MKILNIKKHFVAAQLVVVALAVVSVGCDRDGANIVYNEGDAIELQHADPYLQVVTGFVPFEIGTEEYPIEFNVINGEKALNTVKLYGTFYDAGSGETSNEVLFGEYAINDPERTVITDSFSYEELSAGVTVAGEELPATDEDIVPGSGWSFRFEGDYASGETLPLNGAINMVLSKYAGLYRVSNSHYMRIQVDPVILPPTGVANWNGQEVFIGFVDENTLSYNDWLGYFETPGCSWQFSYDEETGVITEVDHADGVACVSATAAPVTCQSATAFANLSEYLGYDVCLESNVIIDNEVTGEHVIKLTYGYNAAGGYRQFTETLTKIVD